MSKTIRYKPLKCNEDYWIVDWVDTKIYLALKALADEHGRTVKEELAYLVANASLKTSVEKNQFGTIYRGERDPNTKVTIKGE